MRYSLSKDFIKINETTGTVQNPSQIRTLEMSENNTPNSGLLIPPLQAHTFVGTTIYLRCIDGLAEARVVPFLVDVGSANVSVVSGDSSGFDNFDQSDVDDIFKP